MVSTRRHLAAVDLGFNAERLLTFRMALSPRVDAFLARVLRLLQTLPGVESAAGIHILPLSHAGTSRIIAIDGHPAPVVGDESIEWRREDWVRPQYRAVIGNYFSVMGIPLLQGRAFTARDEAEAPWVVVINRAMAERYWPNADPVGQQLTVVRDAFGNPTPGERPRAVVGIVEDVHDWSLQSEPRPVIQGGSPTTFHDYSSACPSIEKALRRRPWGIRV